jgi:hypothetical protein
MHLSTLNFSLGKGGGAGTDPGAMCKLCFILKVRKLCYKVHVIGYSCNITLAAAAVTYTNTATSSVI